MKAFKEHIQKQQFALLEYGEASRESMIAMQKVGWVGCLKWFLKEGEYAATRDLSANELLKLVEKELNNG